MIKKIIKWFTRDGETYYSGTEENAEHLAKAWQKSYPENRYEVVEVEEKS